MSTIDAIKKALATAQRNRTDYIEIPVEWFSALVEFWDAVTDVDDWEEVTEEQFARLQAARKRLES